MNRALTLPSGLWSLELSVPTDSPDGMLFTLTQNEEPVLQAEQSGCVITFTLHTRWTVNTQRYGVQPRFFFSLCAPEGGSRFELMWLDASVRLYADGALVDEDWPLGQPVCGECCLTGPADAVQPSVRALDRRPVDADVPFDGCVQFYVPPYHNGSVGDCLPFVHNGRYRMYHLFDRRHHRSKQGLGAHQWAHISSGDLKNWTLHPIAVGIDEQWEGSICTGSMIERDGTVYAFYAVRMSDGSPARLTWATSEDGVHFTKSHEYFSLTEPYEPVSARDPKVFRDAEGLYHMLVTTSLTDGRRRPGCLAHLTSEDLLSWTQREPMLIPGYADQPECSDYFEWNGRYYIVFANHLTARYRISDQPFGPWKRPQDDILVSPNLAVPKTAQWNGRRLTSGWVGDHGWGGCALTFELIQRPDGSLGVKHIEELMPNLPAPSVQAACADGSLSYAEHALAACGDCFRLKGTISLSDPGAAGELLLRFGEAEYRITFDPSEKTVSFAFPGDRPLDVNGRHRLLNADFLDRPFHVDLIVHKGILMLLLPDGRLLMPSRLEHTGACELLIACRDGKMEFTPDN